MRSALNRSHGLCRIFAYRRRHTQCVALVPSRALCRICMLEDSNKIKLLDNSAVELSKKHGLLVITFMGLIL